MVEELCEVVEVRRVSDRVMSVMLVFEDDVLRLICWYSLQSGRILGRNTVFMMSGVVSEICII